MRSHGVVALLLVAGAAVGLMSARDSRAASAQTIQYQGRLTDSNGVPLEGTLARLTFRLYSTVAPSTSSFLWGEVHEGVPVRRGVFTVQLGAGTRQIDASGVETPGANPFGGEFEGGAPRWIQVQVNADAPLSPLAQLGSVPHALSATGVVPLGGIMPWWPSTAGAPVPEGFELCDGGPVVTAGSPYAGLTKPDLMSTPRVPRGLPVSALGSYGGAAPFEYGGADDAPAHDHGAGNHRHHLAPGGGPLTTTTEGSHNHGERTGPEESDFDSQTTDGELLYTFARRDHHHKITSDGQHSHTTLETQSGDVIGGSGTTASGGAHDNRPAFVSLAYIVRVK